MKKLTLLLCLLFLFSCEDEEVITQDNVVIPVETEDTYEPVETNIPNPFSVSNLNPLPITQVVFEAEANSLNEDVVLNFDGKNTFSGLAPFEADIYNLIPTFEMTDATANVYVDGQLIENGLTAKDFSKEIIVHTQNADKTASSVYLIRLSYDTGLPKLYIDIAGGETVEYPDWNNKYYFDASLTLYGGLNEEDIALTDIKIRGRGNSSWWQGTVWGKKPYQIEFFDRVEVLGMPRDRRWVLLSDLSDKTMIRNRISYHIGSLSHLDYTPTGKYVDLVVNGEPQGTYLLAQKVEESTNRVNIGPTGYLLEIDQTHRLKAGDVFIQETEFKNKVVEEHGWGNEIVLCIKSPLVSEGSPEYELIEDHIIDFESVLFGNDFANPYTGYRSYIDVDSFVDWYIIQEIAKSVDARWYASIFFSYVPGEKIKLGPLWDFDLSYGNVDYADSQFADGFWIKQNPWIKRLFEDPYFANLVQVRFQFFKNSLPDILNKIDEYSQHIYLSQQKNYEIFPTLGEYVWPNPVYYPTYEEEVEHLKGWLTARIDWLDSNL
jgi:hypothetical protein